MRAPDGYSNLIKLSQDAGTALFSGICDKTAQPVHIRQICPNGMPSANRSSILERYNQLKTIPPEHGIRLLDLAGTTAFPGHYIFLIHETVGEETLQHHLDEGRFPVSDFLLLAKQLTDCVKNLHRRGILINVLSPAVVLYDPAVQRLRLDTAGILLGDLLPAMDNTPDNPALPNRHALQLPYTAPEQTGRLNCPVDHRSDLYSLGTVLYAMITGRPPFAFEDPTEIIHAHLARNPTPPTRIWIDIPEQLSGMIMKLMEKTPAARYQSTYGLLADINQCKKQYGETGTILPFALGSEDVPETVHIAPKLFGREHELAQMMDVFERVRNSGAEMILLNGDAGIGKTRLVQEMNRHVAKAGGYVGVGKYDPLQRNYPYSAIIQAFQEVIRQILTESAEQIQIWKKKLLEAIGIHGQIMVNVIPEIELIIGPQPPAPEMSSPEAQNRFHKMFERFIQVFARPNHPLVLFLDDLHWIDSASLKLMEQFLSAATIPYCLFIGAFRGNELAKNRNLSMAFSAILKNQFPITMIPLSGIEAEHVRQIIIASLSKKVENLDRLPQIIREKTGGNPFFIGQFILAMAAKRILCFDYDTGVWQWHEDAVTTETITDNVVGIMLDEIQKLPGGTQNIMKLAACIGDRFDFQILAAVSETPLAETARLLAESVKAGYIRARGESNRLLHEIIAAGKSNIPAPDFSTENQYPSFVFEFLHDRVRQAVYSLVPIEQRKPVHFRIGRLMLKHMKQAHFPYNIFNLVNQLNYGVDMIGTGPDPIELAGLNLKAGRMAKESTAYALALSYLITGVTLLPKTCWNEQYALARDLYFEKMECEYLNRNFDSADTSFRVITEHVRSDMDKARAFNIKMIMFAGQARHQEAVAIGLAGLRFLGVYLAEPGGIGSVLPTLLLSRLRLSRRSIVQLSQLPEASDPRQDLIMKMLMNISFSAYLCNPYLIVTVAIQIIRRSMKYGNTHASSTGYVIYGAVLCAIFGAYDKGNRFGDLSLRIQETFGQAETNPKIFLYYAMGICLWRHPIPIALEHNRNGLADALETGDCNYAVYHIQSILIFLFAQGTPLAKIYSECETYYDYISGTGDSAALNYLISLQQVIKCLQGRTENDTRIDDRDFSEGPHIERIAAENIPIILLRHHLLKMRLLYIMGDMDEAFRLSKICEGLLKYHIGTIIVAEFYCYQSLILTARYRSASRMEKTTTRYRLRRNEKAIAAMARTCPANFEHKRYLLQAEKARIQNRMSDAVLYFQKAIQSARENSFIQMEAIADELAARLYLEMGLVTLAAALLSDAFQAYQKWGADAKTARLVKQHPNLLPHQTGPLLVPTASRRIDYTDVMNSLRTISTEIVLDNLIKKLMQLVIRNAGARKGVLLLNTDNRLTVRAVGHIGDPIRVTLQNDAVTNRTDMLAAAIHYVQRTRKTLVLDDAFRQGAFSADPYMIQARPKSVLCLPLLRKDTLIGILYLENDITAGTFTPDRMETLQLIASQAAISFENARLYDHVLQKEKDLRNLSEKLRSLSSELLLTEERERRRIAIELHDRIGHALANMRIQLGLLQETVEPDAPDQILMKIHGLVDQSIVDAQTLTFELSPPVLYDLGLEAALEWLVYQMQVQHGIDIQFSADPLPPDTVKEDLRILIFQAARELLFNVVKHAQAHHASISLNRMGDVLNVVIEDDGIGFESEKPGYLTSRGGGFGLFSIQERLKYQGGRLDISSKPGHGTNIVMILPIEPEKSGGPRPPV